jgi:hypothetical protein
LGSTANAACECLLGADPFASDLMPRGNVRLFRDDFLNNNPILLEYLAQDAGATPTVGLDGSGSAAELSREGNESLAPATSSFVDKMRSANPQPRRDAEAAAVDDVASTMSSELNKLSLCPSVSTSHLGVDPSDPNTTIRKLLKHIEVLMVRLPCQTAALVSSYRHVRCCRKRWPGARTTSSTPSTTRCWRRTGSSRRKTTTSPSCKRRSKP